MDTPFFNPDEIRILIQNNLANGVIEKALSQLTMEDINNLHWGYVVWIPWYICFMDLSNDYLNHGFEN